MTDLSQDAVEILATELPDAQWQAPMLHRAADTLRALSSQLEAANQRAEMLANSLATARAEALKEAAEACKGHRYGFPNEIMDSCNLRKTHRNDIAAAIIALIPASKATCLHMTAEMAAE